MSEITHSDLIEALDRTRKSVEKEKRLLTAEIHRLMFRWGTMKNIFQNKTSLLRSIMLGVKESMILQFVHHAKIL